jgi:hypothetical protein
MELTEFKQKEKEIYSKIDHAIKEQQLLHQDLEDLYSVAIKDGFVWDSTEKKWYKDE